MTLAPGTLFIPSGGVIDLNDTYSGNWIGDRLMVMMGPVDRDEDYEIYQTIHGLTIPGIHRDPSNLDADIYVTKTAHNKIAKMNDMFENDEHFTEGFIKLSDQVSENQRVSWVLIGGQNRPAILVHWNGEKCVKYGQSQRAGRVCTSNN